MISLQQTKWSQACSGCLQRSWDRSARECLEGLDRTVIQHILLMIRRVTMSACLHMGKQVSPWKFIGWVDTHSGSGKSYSMVGYGVDKGIIPCACQGDVVAKWPSLTFHRLSELFRRISENPDSTVTFKVLQLISRIWHSMKSIFKGWSKHDGNIQWKSQRPVQPHKQKQWEWVESTR